MTNINNILIDNKTLKKAAIAVLPLEIFLIYLLPFLHIPSSIKSVSIKLISWLNFGIQILLAILLIITMKSFLNKSLNDFRKRGASNIFKAIFYGLGLSLCFIIAWGIIVVNLNLLKYLIHGANAMALHKEALESPILFVLSTCIFGPFIEECVFRSIIFELLKKKNVAVAMIGTAILFALAHIMSNFGDSSIKPISLLLLFVNYFLLALALSIIYKKYNNIWINIGMHMTWNSLFCLLTLALINR